VLLGRGLCDELITRPSGVLPTVVRRCVWSRNLVNVEALAHWGLLRQEQTNPCSTPFNIKILAFFIYFQTRVLGISMFHRAFFNSIIDKHQHLHLTFNSILLIYFWMWGACVGVYQLVKSFRYPRVSNFSDKPFFWYKPLLLISRQS